MGQSGARAACAGASSYKYLVNCTVRSAVQYQQYQQKELVARRSQPHSVVVVRSSFVLLYK
jgi:hypothetical protein